MTHQHLVQHKNEKKKRKKQPKGIDQIINSHK